MISWISPRAHPDLTTLRPGPAAPKLPRPTVDCRCRCDCRRAAQSDPKSNRCTASPTCHAGLRGCVHGHCEQNGIASKRRSGIHPRHRKCNRVDVANACQINICFGAEVSTRPADLAHEAAALAGLRRWAGRYAPMVASDGADGLMADISSVPHLFYGEEDLRYASTHRASSTTCASLNQSG